MGKYSRVLSILVISFTFFYLFRLQPAYAYLDPGTGSYFFQLIIATLLGGLFAVKLFWHRIKIFWKNLFFNRKNEEAKK